MVIPSEDYIRNNNANYKKSQNKSYRQFYSVNKVHQCKIYLSQREYTILNVNAKRLKLSKSSFIRYLINEFHREFKFSNTSKNINKGNEYQEGFSKIAEIWNNMFKK